VARSLFQLSVPARRTLNPALHHRGGMITLLLPGRGCTPSREFFGPFLRRQMVNFQPAVTAGSLNRFASAGSSSGGWPEHLWIPTKSPLPEADWNHSRTFIRGWTVARPRR
jgi:hypothetical protein